MPAPSRTSAARSAREELGGALSRQAQATQQQLTGMAGAQSEQLKHFGERLADAHEIQRARLEAVRATVEQKLDALRADNAQKLEQMRATVDEKLQTTLDQRLGASFKRCPIGWSRCTRAWATCRTWPSASAI